MFYFIRYRHRKLIDRFVCPADAVDSLAGDLHFRAGVGSPRRSVHTSLGLLDAPNQDPNLHGQGHGLRHQRRNNLSLFVTYPSVDAY